MLKGELQKFLGMKASNDEQFATFSGLGKSWMAFR